MGASRTTSSENWASYLEGMRYVHKLVDPAADLICVPRNVASDWGQPNVNGFQNSAQAFFFHTDISSPLTQNWTPIGATSHELPGEISPSIPSFEIQAHLVAGHARRVLDLIRSSWGWYLDNENGTQNTTIEAYIVSGTFGYRWDYGYNGDFSYTSHTHSWATGPVTALTQHVLGLSIVEPAGSTWRLAPRLRDLTSCEGGSRRNWADSPPVGN
ncbi:hypothetical protein DL769_002451 [Monosporascus sp. CRB-8-3]|nr:hypothetical protein DL769_002451 [Monosporascus sp. CRB-8-3]